MSCSICLFQCFQRRLSMSYNHLPAAPLLHAMLLRWHLEVSLHPHLSLQHTLQPVLHGRTPRDDWRCFALLHDTYASHWLHMGTISPYVSMFSWFFILPSLCQDARSGRDVATKKSKRSQENHTFTAVHSWQVDASWHKLHQFGLYFGFYWRSWHDFTWHHMPLSQSCQLTYFIHVHPMFILQSLSDCQIWAELR